MPELRRRRSELETRRPVDRAELSWTIEQKEVCQSAKQGKARQRARKCARASFPRNFGPCRVYSRRDGKVKRKVNYKNQQLRTGYSTRSQRRFGPRQADGGKWRRHSMLRIPRSSQAKRGSIPPLTFRFFFAYTTCIGVRRRFGRCMKHLKAAFGTSRLVDITADSIELFLRDRLRQRVQVKIKLGYRQLGAIKATTVHQEFRVLRCMLNVAVRKKLLRANPCSGVEFPVAVRGLFRPHYVAWSEQQKIESHSPQYLRNVIRIITETGLRVYKELTPLRKDQVDLLNAVVWIPDSKTPNGVAEVPLSPLVVEALKSQMAVSGNGPFLFPSDQYPGQHQTTLKTVWRKTLRRAEVPYFRIYDLRSTYATRLSAGGVADEWVTQMLRQSDAQVFKKYSQMKLQMKREALEKLNRRANEMAPAPPSALISAPMCTVLPQ